MALQEHGRKGGLFICCTLPRGSLSHDDMVKRFNLRPVRADAPVEPGEMLAGQGLKQAM